MNEPLAVREAPASYLVEPDAQRIRPGYKRTEVGVIPEDWELRKIGELCEYQNGTSLEHLFNHDDGLKVISIGNYSVTGGYNDNGVYISLKHKKSVEKFVLKRNDLTMSLNDKTSSGAIIGRVLLIEQNDLFVFNQRTMRLRPKYNVSPAYLHHAINADRAHSALVGLAKPGTQIYINTDDVIDLKLPVPRHPEQEAIATALSDVDALVASLDKLIAKKRDLKQAAMQQLLTGQRRLPGFSGDWEVKRLGDVLDKIVGGGTPSRSNPNYWGEEIPWVTVKDFATFNPRQAQESITQEGLKHSASHLIPRGTLITSTRMALGKAVIYEVDVAINQDLKALFPNSALTTQYLYIWFQYHGQSIDELGSGSTVKGITLSDLGKISFLLPPLNEQTTIATLLSDMDSEIAALEARRDKTRAIKQGMMQELLTGRIRLV